MTLRLDMDGYTRRLRESVITSYATTTERSGFVLRVWHADTLLAEGECAPMPGYSPDTLEDCLATAQSWCDNTDGIDDPARWLARSASLKTLPALSNAAQCIAIQLATRRGQQLPHWPAPFRQRVQARAVANSPNKAVARVQEGFQVLKIKVGAASIAEDVQRVADIRRAVGDRITLHLDANRAWSEIDAHNAVDVFAPSRIALLEEPMATGGARELAELRAYSTIPIGADEQAREEASVRNLIDEAAMDVLVLKPMTVGGPLTCMALANIAKQRGTDTIVTTCIEGPVGTAMTIQLAARIDTLQAHGLATSVLFEDSSDFPTIDAGGYNLGDLK